MLPYETLQLLRNQFTFGWEIVVHSGFIYLIMGKSYSVTINVHNSLFQNHTLPKNFPYLSLEFYSPPALEADRTETQTIFFKFTGIIRTLGVWVKNNLNLNIFYLFILNSIIN